MEVRPMGRFFFFWRGLLWKLEVVQLTSAFTRRTFLENEVVRGASFFTEGIFTENSRATKGSLLSQKDLSLLNFRPLLLVGLGRISNQEEGLLIDPSPILKDFSMYIRERRGRPLSSTLTKLPSRIIT
jgi:hypothetical protein